MKKSIRLLGTTLLLTGMGIGGTALTAGAASADTGTQPVTVQASNLDLSGKDWNKDKDKDKDWNKDKCWCHDRDWNRDHKGDRGRDHHKGDDCRDHHRGDKHHDKDHGRHW
ncbi:MAG: hypothetical protein QOH19_2615 [Actinomycetota bacterium]|jgi:hypothetical protein|nr:hypothetical protein [Actinomycetota bacterium]